MKLCIKALLLIISTLLLASCSFTQGNNKSKLMNQNEFEVNDNNLELLVINGLKQRKDLQVNRSDLYLDYPYYEDSAVFSTFYFQSDQDIKLGLVYAEWINGRYELEFIDFYSVEEDNPFSVVDVVGSMKGGKRDFKVILGYIFKDSITEIRVEYNNNLVNSIKIDKNNRTFLDVVTGAIPTQKKIESRDAHDEIIFQYDY